ncbi:MAG TPA: hypothetical protein VIM46_03205 [Luteolibacter sp.]
MSLAAACALFAACDSRKPSAPAAETPAPAPVAVAEPSATTPPVDVPVVPPPAPIAPPEPPAPVEPPPPPFPRAGRRFAVADAPDLPLPVVCRRGKLDVYTRLVHETEGRLSPDAIRPEELLNAFDLRPAGAAAIAKGTSLAVETLACPWKPSAVLLLARVENLGDTPHEVGATLHLEGAAISRYRLIGSPAGEPADPLPTNLPPKSGISLLIELEPRATGTAMGEIRWSVDGSPVAPIALVRSPAAEPGNDARFAALLGAFSLWLANDQPEVIDDAVVAGLARECTDEELPDDRKQALVLIARALDRAEPKPEE